MLLMSSHRSELASRTRPIRSSGICTACLVGDDGTCTATGSAARTVSGEAGSSLHVALSWLQSKSPRRPSEVAQRYSVLSQ